MFYKDKPIDWLLDHLLWVKVCNPEKDAVSTTFINTYVIFGGWGTKLFHLGGGGERLLRQVDLPEI